MTVATELSGWQGCLFVAERPAVDASLVGIEHHWLDDTTWVAFAPNWLGGADEVFAELARLLPWKQRRVTMWQRELPEPRLTSWWDGSDGSTEALPVLREMRLALGHHFARNFDTIGFNLYRDGNDSVAWHADRERFTHEDPVVAIVSTGAPRPFLLRPRGGGRSHRFCVGHGDLLVMGGACQHDWEHCVPKVACAAGPRLSIMFRHDLADRPEINRRQR